MEDASRGSIDGAVLRRLRIQAGLNQRDLAERAGVSARTVRYLESGGVGRPLASSLYRLAGALGLPVERLAAPSDTETNLRIRIEVLGPLVLRRGGVVTEVTSSMQRSLLGLFALQPGRVLGVDEIVDLLWPAAPPRTCLQLVHTYVRQVRRLLEPVRGAGRPGVLSRAAGGYRLDLEPEQSDLLMFERCVRQAADAWSAGAAQSAVQLHREAWACWRGPVLAGADVRLRAHPAAGAAAQRRISAVEEWTDAALHLAQYSEILGPLRTLHAEEPLHEGLVARLMLALAGNGQQAAALVLFDTVRARLDAQLGVTPGAELRAAHLRVLRGQLPVTVPGEFPASAPAASTGPHPPPAQVPTDVAEFTGRESHLRALDALLPDRSVAAPPDFSSARSAIVTIAGMGGVGKTALAVHWAHRVREHFSDGQLYVNLRGHSAEGPLRPLDALTGFLLALGIPADRVPDDEAHASALYRSRLAGKRVLVLLDNAASAEQVRPLLLAAAGSLVVVTSRERMTGLIARDGARLLTLDVLSPWEAATLLERMIGPERITAEPGACAELARLCAHLPLALRIAAANLAGRPHHRLTDYAARLAEGDRLGALAVDGDAETAVRATFALSCDALPAPERRMFRLLGLVPGPDSTAPSAAALAGVAPADAERLLDRLTSRHLLEEHLPGRYTIHDLLLLLAVELAAGEEDEVSRTAALRRLATHYHAEVADAELLLYPHLLRLPDSVLTFPADPAIGRPDQPGRFADAAAALRWLDAERGDLVALIVHLAQSGHHAEAWTLASRLNGYFVLRHHTRDWLTVAHAARSAALADGNPTALAAAELHLGMAEDALCRTADASRSYQRAVEHAQHAGWTQCHAVALNNLARSFWLSAQIDETIGCLTEALALHRQSGRQAGEAVTLANLAGAHLERARAGDREDGRIEALQLLDAALTLHRSIDDRRNEGETLRLMAEAHRDRGDQPRALRLAEKAVESARSVGDVRFETTALGTLATVEARLGEGQAGLEHHADALRLVAELGDQHLRGCLLLDLADTQARLGLVEDALLHLDDLGDLARRHGAPLFERQAQRVKRLIEHRDGRGDQLRDLPGLARTGTGDGRVR